LNLDFRLKLVLLKPFSNFIVIFMGNRKRKIDQFLRKKNFFWIEFGLVFES